MQYICVLHGRRSSPGRRVNSLSAWRGNGLALDRVLGRRLVRRYRHRPRVVTCWRTLGELRSSDGGRPVAGVAEGCEEVEDGVDCEHRLYLHRMLFDRQARGAHAKALRAAERGRLLDGAVHQPADDVHTALVEGGERVRRVGRQVDDLVQREVCASLLLNRAHVPSLEAARQRVRGAARQTAHVQRERRLKLAVDRVREAELPREALLLLLAHQLVVRHVDGHAHARYKTRHQPRGHRRLGVVLLLAHRQVRLPAQALRLGARLVVEAREVDLARAAHGSRGQRALLALPFPPAAVRRLDAQKAAQLLLLLAQPLGGEQLDERGGELTDGPPDRAAERTLAQHGSRTPRQQLEEPADAA
mmetsp:Transcript_19086/g.48625  ORF Transcript_19086/g.48625 Transcript_19086/m.48625 type:complete len:360 (-) Transcript_19086:85-1164(-)